MSSSAPFDIGTLITSTPGVYGGRPCLAGTRFPVLQIAAYVRDGATLEDLLNAFPHLGRTRILAGMTYYFANREAFDSELDEEINAFEQELERREAHPGRPD